MTMRGWRSCLALSCLAAAWAIGLPAAHAQNPATLHVDAQTVQILTGTLQRIAQSGRVRLTYREDVLPFSFVPENWRRPVGYSIAICSAVVESLSTRLGKPLLIEWIPVSAANRFEVIEQERADFECGTSSDTPQRRQHLSFSAPIFATGTRLLVRTESALRRLPDVIGKRAGVVLGTSAGPALTDWLNGQNALPDQPPLREFASYKQGLDALEQGGVDALLGDEVLLYALLTREHKRRDYRFVGTWVSFDVYGIAFKKADNGQLKVWLDGVLSRMAANRQLHALYTRWFERRLPAGQNNLKLPLNATTQRMFEMLGRDAEPPR